MTTGLTLGGASAIAASSILQVVVGTASTGTSTNSLTYVNTTLSVSVTPKVAGSKMLIIAQGEAAPFTTTGFLAWVSIGRDTTNLGGNQNGNFGYTAVSGYGAPITLVTVDTAPDTSAHVYRVQQRVNNTSQTIGWGVSGNISNITVIEIAQ